MGRATCGRSVICKVQARATGERRGHKTNHGRKMGRKLQDGTKKQKKSGKILQRTVEMGKINHGNIWYLVHSYQKVRWEKKRHGKWSFCAVRGAKQIAGIMQRAVRWESVENWCRELGVISPSEVQVRERGRWKHFSRTRLKMYCSCCYGVVVLMLIFCCCLSEQPRRFLDSLVKAVSVCSNNIISGSNNNSSGSVRSYYVLQIV